VSAPRATYAEKTRRSPHRSLFRDALAQRARAVAPGCDAVHEYLIDQANLRGFLGAYSNREDLGALDPSLRVEEIAVGLLQPHAPAEGRVLKLVLRMVQSDRLDLDRLLLLARRERALPVLAWLVDLVPEPERTPPVRALAERLARHPPRDSSRPELDYTPSRLLRRRR
jgi:hypothetical protein